MEEGFPTDGSTDDKLKFLIQYAILAPSVRNSQPWNFRVEDGVIRLHLDRSRARRTTDPELRELIISCGAALQHLCVAARRFGFNLEVETLPEGKPSLLAIVRLDGKKKATEDETIMFYAIHKWLNVPQPFRAKKKVPDALLDELSRMANTDNTWLHVARESAGRDTIAGLIAEGDLAQKKGEEERKQQAAAAPAPIKRRKQDKRSILQIDVAEGAGHIASYIQSFFKRPVGESKIIARSKKSLTDSEAVLVILGTHENSPASWLAAGQTLAAILLRGLAVGVRASFLNQPVQLPELRNKLIEDLDLPGYPQVLLHLGYPESAQNARSASPDQVREEFI